jgi:hypothetical protein
MTSNLKITRDLSVGGGRVGWCKTRKPAHSAKHSCKNNKSVQRRMKKLLAKRQLKKRVDDRDILSFYAFPPSTPSNTTQFLIDRLENDPPIPEPLDFAFSYGSMDGLMDLRTTQSCRMNALSESLTSNTHKFHHLELTN